MFRGETVETPIWKVMRKNAAEVGDPVETGDFGQSAGSQKSLRVRCCPVPKVVTVPIF